MRSNSFEKSGEEVFQQPVRSETYLGKIRLQGGNSLLLKILINFNYLLKMKSNFIYFILIIFIGNFSYASEFDFSLPTEENCTTCSRDIEILSKESNKTKSLILECISYCKSDNIKKYKVNELLDCSVPLVAFHQSMNPSTTSCQSVVKFHVTLYRSNTNRFGDVFQTNFYCTWSGNNYVISSSCSN